MMNVAPVTTLAFLSALCVFMLKAGAAYLCCDVLSRLATSARLRFIMWLGYLTGTAACLITILLPIAGSTVGVRDVRFGAPASQATISWTVPPPAALYVEQLRLAVSFAYAAMLLLLAGVGLWKRIQLARALGFRLPAPAAIVSLLETIRSEVGAPRCAVWLLPGLTAPAALGWWSGAIYLPCDCTDETDAALQNVLRHEVAHVARRDALWETIARLCRWLVFFHPLVHRAFANLRLARELACDMAVVQANPDRRDDYAQTLVRFGWKTAAAHLPDRVGISFTSQSAVLSVRVRSILAGGRVHSRWSTMTRMVGGAGAISLFAATVPAVWIGFALAANAPSATVLATNQASPRTYRPPPKLHSKIDTSPAPQPTPMTNVALLQPRPAADRLHGFHVQNEDEPMSNPVPDSESPTGDGSTSSQTPAAARHRVGGPSTTSVLMDSATRLGRVALSGGRDHDHD